MDRLAAVVLTYLLAVALGARAGAAPAELGEKELRNTWFGHAFLLIESKQVRIATDPFNGSVGYPIPDVTADAILVTHGHGDHNNVAAVKGNPTVVTGTGQHEAAGISVKGVGTRHFDDETDARRGDNSVFVWKQGGITLAHCGDLGHVLSDAQVAETGPIDLLMIPVGGHYTIDAAKAKRVIQQLKPKIVFPMHYLTDALAGGRSPLAPADAFLDLLEGDANIDSEGAHAVTLVADGLPQDKPRVIVLSWK